MLPLVLLALALLTAAYLNAQQTATRLFDKTLLAVALAVSEHVVRSDGDLLSAGFLEVVSASLRDRMYYHVRGPDGAFVTGYTDAPRCQPVPNSPAPGLCFSTPTTRGGRCASSRCAGSRPPDVRGWVSIRVWQTIEERAALAREMLLKAVAGPECSFCSPRRPAGTG